MKTNWAIKLTPVAGVIELGTIEPFPLVVPAHVYMEQFDTIPAIEEYIKANGMHCNDRNHWWNSHLANVYDPNRSTDDFGPNHWHTDTDSGRDRGPDMIMMIAGEQCGTHFSGPPDLLPYKTRFVAIPWHIYLVHGDIMHRAPFDVPANVSRVCYRWYQSDKQIDDNSRRNEDGEYVLSHGN